MNIKYIAYAYSIKENETLNFFIQVASPLYHKNYWIHCLKVCVRQN